MNFVRADGVNMVRLPGGDLDPFQVEMPLACALTPPDHVLVRTHEARNKPLRRLGVLLTELPVRLKISFPFVTIDLGRSEAPGLPRGTQSSTASTAQSTIEWLYPRTHGKTASDYFARLTTRLDDTLPDCRIDRYRPSSHSSANA